MDGVLEAVTEEGLSNTEFNRRVEAFYAKVALLFSTPGDIAEGGHDFLTKTILNRS